LTDPDWTQWNDFIVAEGIPTCNEEVVRRYQNIEQVSTYYLEASSLNHFLNLRHHGLVSEYAALANDRYGDDEDDHRVTASLTALEQVFAGKACRFTSDSVVYKGVAFEPFYRICSFESIRPAEEIQFHGFLSTSVCREKALDFVHGSGVLLVIRGLDQVDSIVPENSSVRTTKNAVVPEHEVLLRCGVKMRVEDVVDARLGVPREVRLKVVGTQ
jgi:hypothetical protein